VVTVSAGAVYAENAPASPNASSKKRSPIVA
jgi:hypothetical protein